MPIKILLVDDHTVVRSGLSKFLMVNKEFKLVGEASDGAEAVQMVSLLSLLINAIPTAALSNMARKRASDSRKCSVDSFNCARVCLCSLISSASAKI